MVWELAEARQGGSLTRLAADLIVAVAPCVETGRKATLVLCHLHRVLLQPPDEPFHQPELDESPGGEHDTEPSGSPCSSASAFRICPHHPGLAPLIHALQLQGVAGDEVPHRGTGAEAAVQLEDVTEAGSLVPCGDVLLSAPMGTFPSIWSLAQL